MAYWTIRIFVRPFRVPPEVAPVQRTPLRACITGSSSALGTGPREEVVDHVAECRRVVGKQRLFPRAWLA